MPRLGGASRASQLGIGLVQRDTILGVTKGDIRRLARRGGVKRISATVYDEVRQAMKARLHDILREVVAVVEYAGRTTVCVTDIIFILNRQGRHIYGFDPAFALRQ
ncbi:hypothetical protein EJ07DRAFT_106292 [Lizonia empirigonia]|nr:hypothetical protein EJ07DRAFT_106292 [Lizonia empirigonia]